MAGIDGLDLHPGVQFDVDGDVVPGAFARMQVLHGHALCVGVDRSARQCQYGIGRPGRVEARPDDGRKLERIPPVPVGEGVKVPDVDVDPVAGSMFATFCSKMLGRCCVSRLARYPWARASA